MGVLRCALLVVMPWISANLISMVHTLLMSHLSFCTNRIPHFVCDLNALIKLSCSDTQVNEMLVLVLGGPVVLISFVCIMASYTPIAVAMWKVPSVQGRWKAFSTCGSHLCDYHWGLLHPCIHTHHPEGHGSHSDVHHGHPHAEPLHLQPEELRSEGGAQETFHWEPLYEDAL